MKKKKGHILKMSKQRRVISFKEQYYEKFKKIEMKIIYIILVHNFPK